MGRYDRLQVIWADAGYGGKLVGWAQATAGWSLELVRRPAQQPTFQVLSRRWVVERTLGWLNLQRWLGSGLEKRLRLFSVAVAIVLAAGALLSVLDAWADAPDGEWQFFKPVFLSDDLSVSRLVEVELDPEVYAHAQLGLGDVRLAATDTAGERQIPYQLLVEAGDQRRAAVPVKMQDLGHIPNDHTSFVLLVQSEGDLHSKVEIQTSSVNFQRRVSVSASDDGETWRILEEHGAIFNVTMPERGFSAGDTSVKYPSRSARFLRVQIFDEEEEPLAIRGAVVLFAQTLEPRRHHLPLDIVQRIEDPERKRTILLLQAFRAGFPADSISLDIPHRNFYREFALEGSYDSIYWIPLQSGEIIYDFDTPRFVGDDRELRFGESRYLYYRITIFNEGNPPLLIEKSMAHGFARKIVFTAAAGETYCLYYGNPEASAPSYELEKLFPYLVTENLPVAHLGLHEVNPAFGAPAPMPVGEPFTERYPWLLPGVVATAALLVGLFLANLIRQVRGRLRPPE